MIFDRIRTVALLSGAAMCFDFVFNLNLAQTIVFLVGLFLVSLALDSGD